MSLDVWGALAAGAVTAAALASGLEQVFKSKFGKKPDLEARISVLTQSLSKSAELVSEIEREVRKRSELASKLQQDVTRYSKLKELNAPQVEAIAQALRAEVQKESRKSLWVTFGQNVFFFILGAAFAYWLARR